MKNEYELSRGVCGVCVCVYVGGGREREGDREGREEREREEKIDMKWKCSIIVCKQNICAEALVHVFLIPYTLAIINC